MSAASEGRGRLPWARLLAGGWLLLLVASYVAWINRSDELELEPGDSAVALQEQHGLELGPREVRLVYRDLGAPAESARATLLLLHGSPGSSHDFDRLLTELPTDLRLILPDLPGFGASEREVADYSVEAHAGYALQLLDHLGVDRAEVIGFSMGGAVAAELVDAAPERARSLCLIAGLGVEELELFGDHQLNHLVHGLQLRAIEAATWLLPHFGTADRWILGVPYARNFYDSDQRRIRPALASYAGPLLVLHGKRDFLVPVESARETARIVPQAELVELDAGHFVLWTRPAELAEELLDYLERVQRGEAPTRARADSLRVDAAALPFDPSVIPPASGPTLLILLLLLVVGTFVSEDLTCIAAGLMVAQGRLTLGPALLGCSAGIFLGDLGLFLAGRWLGRPVVARAPLRWVLDSETLDRASAWFVRRGPRAIFLSRFMPGLRLPTYFAAGVLRTSLPRFIWYFLLAVLAWTPVLVGTAMLFGDRAMELFREWGAPALIAVLFGLLLLERVVVRLFTFSGRRQLVGAWRRWTRWEFWPPLMFYPPIVAYVGWLALRHRSLIGVTAVNPGIRTGGLIGESKSEILAAIDDSTGLVAPFVLLRASATPDERERQALGFAEGHGNGFPTVLKPDVGQRGSGVSILRNEEELIERVRSLEVDHVLQRYVSGEEFGLFYVREPGAERGRLFSITSKVMPEVVGDGVHSLEQLILLGERTVAAAEHYLRAQRERLSDVLEPGERVRLVEIGTHCRGAIFLDGRDLLTPQLEAQVDELSRSFEGFHFGRFDVRASSAAALASGEGFQVLELNGMTAEATHIYDPAHGLLYAYRVLFEQWRIAFAIAAANRAAGARPSAWSEVVGELLGYRGKQRHHGASGRAQSS